MQAQIVVYNESASVTDVDAQKACAAIQRQLTMHFEPIWHQTAVVHFAQKGEAVPAGTWIFKLVDVLPVGVDGALGYHTDEGLPTAFIDVPLCQQDGVTWSSCLSHEVLEAVADPECVRCFDVGGKVYALEVCLAGDTDVMLVDGSRAKIESLVNREAFDVWSADGSGHVVSAKGHSARLTKKNAPVVRVTLADGSFVRCTPEHRFLAENGEYKEARQLLPGERLFSEMTPTHAVSNAMDSGNANRVAGGERLRGFRACYDRLDLRLRKLAAPMGFASPVAIAGQSSLGARVKHIGPMRTNKKVRGIYAGRIVAGMTNLHRRWDWVAVSNFPRYPMSEQRMALLSDLPVPEGMERPRPRPAPLCAPFDARPESLLERGGALVVDIESRTRIGSSSSPQSLVMDHAQSLGSHVPAANLDGARFRHSRVVHAVEPDGNADVYDLTVDEHHNFAVADGIFVHNCDATEGSKNSYGADYEIDGVVLENFVTPQWFMPGSNGPYDYLGILSSPLARTDSGYDETAKIGPWHQASGLKTRSAKRAARPGSRRADRGVTT